MDIIVDLLGFSDGDNFLPKEVCIVTIQQLSFMQWVVEPDSDFDDMTLSLQNSIQHYTQSVHGIRWDEGYVPIAKSVELLKLYTAQSCKIYMWDDGNKQKIGFLQSVLNRRVLDLKWFECPSPDMIFRNPDWTSYCVMHKQKFIRGEMVISCAMRRCAIMRDWIWRMCGGDMTSEGIYAKLYGPISMRLRAALLQRSSNSASGVQQPVAGGSAAPPVPPVASTVPVLNRCSGGGITACNIGNVVMTSTHRFTNAHPSVQNVNISGCVVNNANTRADNNCRPIRVAHPVTRAPVLVRAQPIRALPIRPIPIRPTHARQLPVRAVRSNGVDAILDLTSQSSNDTTRSRANEVHSVVAQHAEAPEPLQSTAPNTASEVSTPQDNTNYSDVEIVETPDQDEAQSQAQAVAEARHTPAFGSPPPSYNSIFGENSGGNLKVYGDNSSDEHTSGCECNV
ncbi:hypothetical protein TKK_0019419 [Trichogramma kaykai]|uniref:Uncharacterized protein n=1 Tax=Trichogramma kaykai TaxID=54128 RepID=A0ABD2VTX7_9HYME